MDKSDVLVVGAQPAIDDPRWVSVGDAAVMLGCSRSEVTRLESVGQLRRTSHLLIVKTYRRRYWKPEVEDLAHRKRIMRALGVPPRRGALAR